MILNAFSYLLSIRISSWEISVHHLSPYFDEVYFLIVKMCECYTYFSISSLSDIVCENIFSNSSIFCQMKHFQFDIVLFAYFLNNCQWNKITENISDVQILGLMLLFFLCIIYFVSFGYTRCS